MNKKKYKLRNEHYFIFMFFQNYLRSQQIILNLNQSYKRIIPKLSKKLLDYCFIYLFLIKKF